MEPIMVEGSNIYGSPALKVRNIHLGVDIISIMLDMYPRAFKNLPLDLKLASRSVQMYMYPNFPKAVENEFKLGGRRQMLAFEYNALGLLPLIVVVDSGQDMLVCHHYLLR